MQWAKNPTALPWAKLVSQLPDLPRCYKVRGLGLVGAHHIICSLFRFGDTPPLFVAFERAAVGSFVSNLPLFVILDILPDASPWFEMYVCMMVPVV